MTPFAPQLERRRPPRLAARLLPALVLLVAVAAPPGAHAASPAASAPAGDAEVAFAQGVLAFHSGDYAAAREHFERAAEAVPEDGAARYWLGLTHLATGSPGDAAREIRRALASDEPGAFDRDEARQRLAEAERRAAAGELAAMAVAAPVWGEDFAVLPEVPRVDGRLSLAWGSDSNPNLLPPGLTLVAPDGNLVAGEESDTFGRAGLRVGFQKADAAERRTAGLIVEGDYAVYDQFGYLDVGRAGVVGQVAWGRDPSGYASGPLGYALTPLGRTPVTFLVQVGAGRNFLDGEAFADELAGALALGFREGGWGQTELRASYRDLDFDGDLPAPLARSGETVRGELVQYFYLGRRNRYLRLTAGASDRDAGAAFDAGSVEAGAELALPLAPRWVLYTAGSWREDDYDAPDSNLLTGAGEPRKDEITRWGAALVWRACDALALSARATGIDHSIAMERGVPGAPDLSYERLVATIGLSWFFGAGR